MIAFRRQYAALLLAFCGACTEGPGGPAPDAGTARDGGEREAPRAVLTTLFADHAAEVTSADRDFLPTEGESGRMVAELDTLTVTLPANGSEAIEITMGDGLEFSIREPSSSGPAERINQSVSYQSSERSTYWSIKGQGVKEWLLISGDAIAEGRVLSWTIAGATVVGATNTAYVLDQSAKARIAITAPTAIDSDGTTLQTSIHTEGDSVHFGITSQTNAEYVLFDPFMAATDCSMLPDGTPCTDDLFCTDGDTCQAGICTPVGPLDCSGAGDQCNNGICNEVSDACEPDPLMDGTGCDDTLYCSDGDSCLAGVCTGGPARDCSGAADQCNNGVCNEVADACEPSPVVDGTGCTDGLFCTDADQCITGVCNSGGARDCSGAADQCNNGVCNEVADACEPDPVADGTGCTDTLFCTDGDQCVTGACDPGPARDCSGFTDQCNTGICNEVADACQPSPVANGTGCNDTMYCTVSDACNAGTCLGNARDCSAWADQCNFGVCNEGGDTCESSPRPNGTVCNDNLYCTVDDRCAAGACLDVDPRDCSAWADQCNFGVCNEGGDTCEPSPRPYGTACNDAEMCTGSDICIIGNCVGTIANLCQARVWHSMTLGGGVVLLAGGFAGTDFLDSTSLHTLATGTWIDGPPMLVPSDAADATRYFHSAAPLLDGRILVAGGVVDNLGGLLASSELFNPATSTWALAASMSAARHSAMAVTLNDGRVLMIGGEASGVGLTSSELYNPGGNSWSAGPALSIARSSARATLLNDGRVLVSGGFNGGPLSSTEIYNGAFGAAAPMASPRYLHRATLLADGRVLVSGGYGAASALSSAEIYNPGTNTWSAAASMATPRLYHTATLRPDGTVVVTGGENDGGRLSSVEIYDPGTNTWTPSTSLIVVRSEHTAELLPTGVLLMGGWNGGNGQSGSELY